MLVMTGHPESAEEDGEGGAHGLQGPLLHTLQNVRNEEENINGIESEYVLPVPMAPVATPVQVSAISMDPSTLSQDPACGGDSMADVKIKFETLRSLDQQTTLDMDRHMIQQQSRSPNISQTMILNSEMMSLMPEEQDKGDMCTHEDIMNDSCQELSNDGITQGIRGLNNQGIGNTPKTWSQHDMENALDALRNHNMSLTKASATFGIPSTTLWQRAHRLGIDTPKKEGPSKSWSEGNLHNALQALRTGTISANKASKAYGIPSSTLYKIARREGIRLAAPFNAAPTAWRPGDLERALHSIRSGHSSVQRASTEYGIPTGTLYGRCKREGIELSRSNPTPWSEDAMGEALEAVRVGQMSINQAAIHYNLPYSSLYGRFKRCKYDGDVAGSLELTSHIPDSHNPHHMLQQPSLGSQVHNMLDHNIPMESSTHNMYSVYHHPLVIPVSLHNPGENHSVNHSNQDCIPIS